jgi:hypothetical protein
MTLQEILEPYGIHRPADLAHVLDTGRQNAWNILHGKQRLTPAQALRLHDQLGVPLEQLLRASVAPRPAPRGRPPQRRQEPPPDTPSEEAQP